MSTRPGISRNNAQRFWEFFIFGLVFTALFLFWFIIKAGLVVGFFTGVLAGLCFTAAWFHWHTRAVPAQEEVVILPVEPVSQEEALETAPVQPAQTEREDSSETTAATEIAPAAEGDDAPTESPEQSGTIEEQPEVTEVQTAESDNIPTIATLETAQDRPEPIEPQSEITEVTAEAAVVETSAIEGSSDETIVLAHLQQDAMVLPALTVPKDLEIEAYCVKCHARRIMHNPQVFAMKNEHHALRGACSVCGSGLFRIISQKQEAEWISHDTAQ
ncbi:MAG TPA: DUF5679 domain-containing protein [Ktedonobacteraceae bacterium]